MGETIMDDVTFLAGAVNSDGDVALFLEHPFAGRPLSISLHPDGRFDMLGRRYRADSVVAHAMSTRERAILVVVDGERIEREFEVALRKAA